MIRIYIIYICIILSQVLIINKYLHLIFTTITHHIDNAFVNVHYYTYITGLVVDIVDTQGIKVFV